MKTLSEEDKKLIRSLHSYVEKGDVISCDKLYKDNPKLNLNFPVVSKEIWCRNYSNYVTAQHVARVL